MRPLLVTLGLALLLTSSGCSSVLSRVAGENYCYYHGTRLDLDNIGNEGKPLSWLLAVDLPFSVVADTLLLPVDALFSPYPGLLAAKRPGYESPPCQ